jgi:hypothetical protein
MPASSLRVRLSLLRLPASLLRPIFPETASTIVETAAIVAETAGIFVESAAIVAEPSGIFVETTDIRC